MTLPRLEELELEWMGGILYGLELPSLRRVSFMGTPFLLEQSSLEELVIRWWDGDEPTWSKILHQLPALRILRIASSHVSGAELRCLKNVDQSNRGVCPRLHTLDFQDVYSIESTFITEVVKSRRNVPEVQPIRTVIVRGCDSDFIDYDAIMALEGDQGVTKVEVQCLDVSWVFESGSGERSDPDSDLEADVEEF
ncbi:hypothetical protein FRB94_012845 [Tulasnella sp. JGI-2019a]|nr:hypothetical protein FRB94_012845 [Tulasnella sp. JGI-2019a]KAG9016385.1 hypothetical protein FRB93_010634 [Tulasnella sp. JGI-2019a]KAG9028404.1 hypothetical protein FRB95_006535 [Tulasnella sp. JGI-2019a]